MIASTSTCGRRMSSLSMTAISERMIFGGAVMTSALVCLSAQIVMLAVGCRRAAAWRGAWRACARPP